MGTDWSWSCERITRSNRSRAATAKMASIMTQCRWWFWFISDPSGAKRRGAPHKCWPTSHYSMPGRAGLLRWCSAAKHPWSGRCLAFTSGSDSVLPPSDRIAPMPWFKVTLTDNDILSLKGLELQDLGEQRCSLLTRADFTNTISPRPLRRSRGRIRRHAGVECPAPAESFVSLLVGSHDAPFGQS